MARDNTGYFPPALSTAGGDFSDPARTSPRVEPGSRGNGACYEDDLDDEFGRWLEIQSLRFRGKLSPA
jgi:hypothetical protein